MLNPRLETFYEKIICEDFVVLYNFTNIAKLPKLENAILSSTSNNFGSSKISVLQSFCGWRLATSQKSVVTRARKSIALFNLRKDALLGLKVTLRKKTLFSFFDKVLIFVLPKNITSISNYKEKQNDITYFSILNGVDNIYGKENNSSFNASETVPCMQNESKPTKLALPSFLKRKQVFFTAADKVVPSATLSLLTRDYQYIKDVKCSYDRRLQLPRKKNIAFLNKLYKNWAKQNHKNISMPFSSNSTLDKKVSVNICSKKKSFFTLSNRIALSFPEISSLLTFFDSFSGFSLTFSLKNSKFSQNFNFTTELVTRSPIQEYLIKKQFFSAFGCPKD